MSSYDKYILSNLKFLKICYALYVLCQLLIPVGSSDGSIILGFSKVYSYILIIFMGIGILGAHGYMTMKVPVISVILIRVVEFILNRNVVSILMFIILIGIDIFLIFSLFNFRERFEYIEEEE